LTRVTEREGKGGLTAAFLFLFLFLIGFAVLGFGETVPLPLAALRTAAFLWALHYLLRNRHDVLNIPLYVLAAGGFAVLAIGHAFSSVYVWVSLQHAVNLALAAVLLAWALDFYKDRLEDRWNRTLLILGGLSAVQISIALYQRLGGGSLRPRGTFENPNFLAEFLVVTGLLLLAGFLGRDGGRRSRFIFLGAGVFFIASGLLLPASRGVFVALVPALGLLFAWKWGMRKGALLFAAVGAPLFIVAGWTAVTRFSGPDVYNYGRLAMWKAALGTFADHPFGVGLGGFKYFWFSAQTPFTGAFRHFGKHAVTAHNEYLEVLAGLGAIGFAAFLVLLGAPLALAARHRRDIPAGKRWIAAGAAAGLVLSGGHAFVNANFHNFGIVALGALLLAALLSCLPPDALPVRRVGVPPWGRRAGIAFCAALLTASLTTYAGTFAYETGGTRMREGRLEEAESAFRTAAALDPLRATFPDALASLHYLRYRETASGTGEAMQGAPFLSEAIRWEMKARVLCPMEKRYALRLSRLTFERFRIEGQVSDLEAAFGFAGEALALDPYSVEALWQRAGMAASVGRPDRAAADLEAAVALEPNFCRGYGRLAGLARDRDAPAAARWRAEEALCRKRAATLPGAEVGRWFFTEREEGETEGG
jgi:O-antigen ligase